MSQETKHILQAIIVWECSSIVVVLRGKKKMQFYPVWHVSLVSWQWAKYPGLSLMKTVENSFFNLEAFQEHTSGYFDTGELS